MAQIQAQGLNKQQSQQVAQGQPNHNGQNVAAVVPDAARGDQGDLMQSMIVTAPSSILDRMGGWFNAKKWHNNTASENFELYKQKPEGKREKYLQAAFAEWVISADQLASDFALTRLISLYKDGEIYQDMAGEGLQGYQSQSPLELFKITVKSGTLTHWAALLEAFQFHWEAQTEFDRILLSQGATLCRALSEKALASKENAVFLGNLRKFGKLLNETLCSQQAYLFDAFLAKVFYDIEMSFEKGAFLENLAGNAEKYGQVYLNSLLAQDAYISEEVKEQTLGNAGLYKEDYAQNALAALSNFVAGRLEVLVKEDGVYINDKLFTVKEAQFFSHLALELKDSPKNGDISLNKLAGFLTEVKGHVTDEAIKKSLMSAVNLLPALSPQSQAARVVEQKVEEVIQKEAQERLFDAFEIYKTQQGSSRGLNDYMPDKAELGRFLKQYGGSKVMQPGAEKDREILLSFLDSMIKVCFKKPAARETAKETESRLVVEAAIGRLSGKPSN